MFQILLKKNYSEKIQTENVLIVRITNQPGCHAFILLLYVTFVQVRTDIVNSVVNFLNFLIFKCFE